MLKTHLRCSAYLAYNMLNETIVDGYYEMDELFYDFCREVKNCTTEFFFTENIVFAKVYFYCAGKEDFDFAKVHLEKSSVNWKKIDEKDFECYLPVKSDKNGYVKLSFKPDITEREQLIRTILQEAKITDCVLSSYIIYTHDSWRDEFRDEFIISLSSDLIVIFLETLPGKMNPEDNKYTADSFVFSEEMKENICNNLSIKKEELRLFNFVKYAHEYDFVVTEEGTQITFLAGGKVVFLDISNDKIKQLTVK